MKKAAEGQNVQEERTKRENSKRVLCAPKVYVTMLGKFTLRQDDMPEPQVISLRGRSRRLWTLAAYLMLHRDRGVPAQELMDLLWPEDDSDCSLSTLQNNISRVRTALAELGFSNAKVIIRNEKGYYRWAPDRETQLDVERFETLSKAALAERDSKKAAELALEAAALYKGDFLSDIAAEFWCINLNTYYRSLYMRLCRMAVDLLLRLHRTADAEKLCGDVIRLNPAAEEFSLFLMQTLIRDRKPQEAIEHYAYIASLYKELYGIEPSADLETQKAAAMQALYGSETDEEDVRAFLAESEKEKGAFCCETRVFREIVQLHLREMQRSGSDAALLIIRLANRMEDRERQAVYMKQMENTLMTALRAGDPFTRKGINQFWVLLPEATKENGETAAQRIENKLKADFPESGAFYTFKVIDLHSLRTGEEKAQ